jgi:hypothetical protein
VGPLEDLALRLDAARGLYLAQGRLTPAELRHSIELVRAHHPVPSAPQLDDMLLSGPLTRAIRSLD